MKEGNLYLVIERRKDYISPIKEWRCIQVSEQAYKIQMEQLKGDRSMFEDNTKPFWILKTEIDTIGKTNYQIIEEL